MTCTAENSVGDLFPVTEDAYFGYSYQARLAEIQDAALDRCYYESNEDRGCILLGCTPGY